MAYDYRYHNIQIAEKLADLCERMPELQRSHDACASQFRKGEVFGKVIGPHTSRIYLYDLEDRAIAEAAGVVVPPLAVLVVTFTIDRAARTQDTEAIQIWRWDEWDVEEAKRLIFGA